MSSFLCFLCHSTVNSHTNEETREKYREVIGISLCPDSHLCQICCHMLNKLWLFKSICLKRSLEYPVLFNEKGTINLQRSDTELHIICLKEMCQNNQNSLIGFNSQHFQYDNETHNEYNDNDNQYVQLHDDKEFDDYFNDQIKSVNEFDENVHDIANYNKHDEFENQNITNNKHSYNDNHNEIIQNDNDFIFGSQESYNANEVNSSLKIETNDNVINEHLKDTQEPKQNKTKKNKKKSFKRIILRLEEQKAELETKRREKKYLQAEFKCYNCALGFLFKDTYQTHMMRHEESNGEHRCDVCTLRFASPAVLRAHVATHGARVECRRCGYRVRNLRRHATKCRSDESATPCHLCGRVFRDASGLQQHLKRAHHSKTSNRVYSCSVCGKSYNNQGAVRTHMIKHIKHKFPCDKCSATFSSPYTLNQHKKKHDVMAQELHYCDTCKVGYTSRKSLLAHRRNALVHQQTVFECPICSRVCPTQRSLTSHMTTVHATTKDYACNICRARYTSRKSLVRHITAHNRPPTNEIHVCHKCPSTFTSRSKLNRHLRKVCEKDELEEVLSSYYHQQPT